MHSPKASRTDKELCKDEAARGRAELFTNEKGQSFTGTGSVRNRMGARRRRENEIQATSGLRCFFAEISPLLFQKL